MKNLLSILLLACLLLSTASCNNRGLSPSESDTDKENGSQTTESESVTEEERIKNAVLDLIRESEMREDPGTMFAHFDGDFQISNITSSLLKVQSIKRKNAVMTVTTNSDSYYSVEAAGHLFVVSEYKGNPHMMSDLPLQADAPQNSTVFTAFGMDTSAVYGLDAEEDPNEMIALTEDMLTVSADKQTCTVAKEYLDAMATVLCEALGYSKSKTELFLKQYEGSGIYSAAENKLSFEIKVNHSSLGNVLQTTSYCIDPEQRVQAESRLEYSNSRQGIKTPIGAEVRYRDIVYQGNTPVSGKIDIRTTADTSFYDGVYPDVVRIHQTQKTDATFTLDCSNTASPKCSAVKEIVWEESFEGESWTRKSLLKLDVDLGKTRDQVVYTKSSDGRVDDSLRANKITFGELTSALVVPQRVTDCITDYIENQP